MISVVIRNKNEEKELSFLLKNLRERYSDDIDDIVVLDNLSTDKSREISNFYKARFVTIEGFSYGESANIAAREALNEIVVIFSAHSFPVSHDFFKLIEEKFKGREEELAGLRCIHNASDYKTYINGIDSAAEPNRAGLIFSGSAFNKRIWAKHPFRKDVRTFEDKEWSIRVLKAGYKIESVCSIFCYDIKRTKRQVFFRYKNDVVGSYQLFHVKYTFLKASKNFIYSLFKLLKIFIYDLYYIFMRFFFMLKFLLNKPEQF